jgi:hypothetical protein
MICGERRGERGKRKMATQYASHRILCLAVLSSHRTLARGEERRGEERIGEPGVPVQEVPGSLL